MFWWFQTPLFYSIASATVLVALVYVAYVLVLRALDRAQARGHLAYQLAVPLRRILGSIAVLIAAFMVLQQFGMLRDAWTTLTALLAVFAVGFVATWSVLSNAFCSVVLLLARPFQIGDSVEVVADNLRGEVVDFTLLFTTLRDDDGALIQIPNNQFFQKAIRRRSGTATTDLGQRFGEPQPGPQEPPPQGRSF
jgi:small-conductance mechanosensitive channel